MKIAIVGANGFLGQELVRNLVSKKNKVLCVYNSKKDNISSSLESVSMKQFLAGNENLHSIIFSAGSFKNTVKENNKLNCENLYQLTLKYPNAKFLYVSSANVYGDNPDLIRENSPFYNPGLYGLSKIGGELIISSLKRFAVVRLVYIYGQGLNNGSFLPNIIEHAKMYGFIGLYGKGLREQDYIHVEDAAELCIKALFHSKNDIFLGATGNSISNKLVADKICKYIEVPCKVKYIEKPETGTSYYYDPSQTMRQLDWKPQISFDTGIKKMLK